MVKLNSLRSTAAAPSLARQFHLALALALRSAHRCHMALALALPLIMAGCATSSRPATPAGTGTAADTSMAPHAGATAAPMLLGQLPASFGGSYTLKGDELGFGPLISTKMYCGGVMEQEQAYFTALEATRGWRVSGRELELTGAGGEVLARFEAG